MRFVSPSSDRLLGLLFFRRLSVSPSRVLVCAWRCQGGAPCDPEIGQGLGKLFRFRVGCRRSPFFFLVAVRHALRTSAVATSSSGVAAVAGTGPHPYRSLTPRPPPPAPCGRPAVGMRSVPASLYFLPAPPPFSSSPHPFLRWQAVHLHTRGHRSGRAVLAVSAGGRGAATFMSSRPPLLYVQPRVLRGPASAPSGRRASAGLSLALSTPGCLGSGSACRACRAGTQSSSTAARGTR